MTEQTIRDGQALVRRIRACKGDAAALALLAEWTRDAVAEEREACAKIADEQDHYGYFGGDESQEIAEKIRARS